MKKFSKLILFGISIIAITPIIAIVLTSCKNNQPASIKKSNLVKLHYSQLGSTILSKTLVEWQNEFQNGNIDQFIVGLKEINDNFIDANFEINDTTTATIIALNTPTSNPIFVNAIATFKNDNVCLEITLDNLFVFPPQNIQHPNLELVQNPIDINQTDLSEIANVDPTLITPNEWITNLNNVAPENSVYIPNTLYYLYSKQFISESTYQLIYKINNQYLPMIDPKLFPDIIFNIKVSPNIDKVLKTDFVINQESANEYLPNLNLDNALSISEIDMYNSLSKYVLQLGNIQSLHDCKIPNTEHIYNYLVIKESITNSILVKFSSNPDSTTETIYFYSFRIYF